MSDAAPVRRIALLTGAAAFAALVVLIGWIGARPILDQVAEGLPFLPVSILIHLVQLLLAAFAWGALLRSPPRASVLFVARWVREAVNSILPTANVGGAVAGARVLSQAGVEAAEGAASATVDITGEALAQILFLLCGLAIIAADPHARLRPAYALAALLPLLVVFGGFFAAQMVGMMQWVERLLNRFLPRKLEGTQDRLFGMYREPRRLLADISLNFLSWSLGAAEVAVLLQGLHRHLSLPECYALESLALVARSAAFLIPGGIAAQETGYALAAALFGLPASAGLAVSLLKRLRELLVGVSGILYFQWLERRFWLLGNGVWGPLSPAGPGQSPGLTVDAKDAQTPPLTPPAQDPPG